MATYEVERPETAEEGIHVACTEHGHRERFQPGRSRVAFYCPDCGFEIEIALHDTLDARPWGELC